MTYRLKINNVYYGNEEALDARQTYQQVEGAVSHRRMADRSLNTQCFGSDKLRTTISGKGWIPPGLDALNKRTDYTLDCLSPRTISSTTYPITVPAARPDVPVVYTVWVDDELESWDGVSEVTGAQTYRATYVPRLQVRLFDMQVTAGLGHPVGWDWQLIFEEI